MLDHGLRSRKGGANLYNGSSTSNDARRLQGRFRARQPNTGSDDELLYSSTNRTQRRSFSSTFVDRVDAIRARLPKVRLVGVDEGRVLA